MADAVRNLLPGPAQITVEGLGLIIHNGHSDYRQHRHADEIIRYRIVIDG